MTMTRANCTGAMPYCAATGIKMGATMMVADSVSILIAAHEQVICFTFANFLKFLNFV